MILLNVFKVVDGTNFKFYCSSIVTYDDSFRMQLQYADGPHLGDTSLYGMVKGLCLIMAVDEDENLLGIHYSTYAYGYGGFRHFIDVIVKET